MACQLFRCSIAEAQRFATMDFRFYTPMQLPEYTMDRVKNMPVADLWDIVTDKFKLTTLEVTRLLDNSPISSSVLLAILDVIVDESSKSGAVMHPMLSDSFFFDREPYSIFTPAHFKKEFVFFPLFISDIKHWPLLYFEPANCSFTYVDPLHCPHSKESLILSRLLLATSKLPSLKSVSWRHIPLNHSVQEDDFSCGIFVAYSERFMATIKKMLTAYCNENQDNWDQHLNALTFAYNTAVHSKTKYSPFFLMYGRKPKIPIH